MARKIVAGCLARGEFWEGGEYPFWNLILRAGVTLSLLIKNSEMKGRWVHPTHFICLIGIFVVCCVRAEQCRLPPGMYQSVRLFQTLKKEAKRIRVA